MRHEQVSKSEAIVVGEMILSEAFAGLVKGRGFRPEMLVDPFHRAAAAAVYGLLDEGKRITLNLVAGRVGPSSSGIPTEIRLAAMISTAKEAEGSAIDEVDPIQDAYQRGRLAEIGKSLVKASEDRDTLIDAPVLGVIDNLTDLVAGAEAKDRRMSTAVHRVRTRAKAAYAKADAVGLATGLTDLDQMLGSIMPGRLTVIGGFPGAGKTVLGYQILHKTAIERGPCLYFQQDMGEADVVNRALSMLTGYPVRKIEAGELDGFELAELTEAEKTQMAMDIELDTDATTVEDITAIATAKKRNGGLSCILVDHLRKYETRRRTRNEWETYRIVTSGLKHLAVKLDVPVVLLSQVTRFAQRKANPIPVMDDLDGGGALEQDADTVLILFNRAKWILANKLDGDRPARDEPEDDDDKDTPRARWIKKYFEAKGKVEVYMPKHRLAEPDQRVTLKFNGRGSKFVDA